jgi:hypothetical protein
MIDNHLTPCVVSRTEPQAYIRFQIIPGAWAVPFSTVETAKKMIVLEELPDAWVQHIPRSVWYPMFECEVIRDV